MLWKGIVFMPIGIIVNFLMIVTGGIVGSLIGSKMSDKFKTNLNSIFGVCALAMGISSAVLMKNMPVVILSVILGFVIGHNIHLQDNIRKCGMLAAKAVSGKKNEQNEEYKSVLITAIVLFCASGTGIYGSNVSGMTGDHSILLAKSILDFPTAMIFACVLGAVTSFIAIPQFVIFMLMYLLAAKIYPFCTEGMIADFKACGGIILLATGFRMMKLKEFPIADMIPAMIIVMPLSSLWVNYVMQWVK